MGLRIKFNVVLVLTLILAGYLLNQSQQQVDQQQTKANETMEMVLSISEGIRDFHREQWLPALETQDFTPLKVPAYNTTESLRSLPGGLSYQVVFQGAELSRYQANLWQQQLLDQLITAKERQLSGVLNDASGTFYYMVRSVLRGADVIGAEVVRFMPPAEVESTGPDGFMRIALVMLMIWLVSNVLFHFVVIHPIQQMASQADAISQGQESTELNVNGSDELSTLAQAFNRLHRSLKAAMNMLS